MNPLVPEWLDKAEGDFTSAQREWRARKAPNFDDACFHAQQCAEKYMKAILIEKKILFPKTHDLIKLLDLLLPTDPSWALLRPALHDLSSYGVELRYPGDSADKATARKAIAYCREVRQKARATLGVPALDP